MWPEILKTYAGCLLSPSLPVAYYYCKQQHFLPLPDPFPPPMKKEMLLPLPLHNSISAPAPLIRIMWLVWFRLACAVLVWTPLRPHDYQVGRGIADLIAWAFYWNNTRSCGCMEGWKPSMRNKIWDISLAVKVDSLFNCMPWTGGSERSELSQGLSYLNIVDEWVTQGCHNSYICPIFALKQFSRLQFVYAAELFNPCRTIYVKVYYKRCYHSRVD